MAVKKIFLAAGEVSGDTHGAHLMKELHKIGEYEFYGLGGKKMFSEGLRSIEKDVSTLNTIGFLEMFRYLFRHLGILDKALRSISSGDFDAVIAIDNQGFNIPLLKAVRKMGIRTVFLMAPMVSIWGSWNAPKIPKTSDYLVAQLDGDAQMYRQYSPNVIYEGNPLIDRVVSFSPEPEWKAKIGLDPKKKTFGLFPGSRQQEVGKFLPEMLIAARSLTDDYGMQGVLAISHPVFEAPIRKGIRKMGLEEKLPAFLDRAYDVMAISDVNLMASGTATLESALFRNPPVICYRVSRVSAFFVKRLIKIPLVGLPNLLLQEAVFPELLQENCCARRMIEETVKLAEIGEVGFGKVFNRIREKVGEPPVMGRIAKAIAERI